MVLLDTGNSVYLTCRYYLSSFKELTRRAVLKQGILFLHSVLLLKCKPCLLLSRVIPHLSHTIG